MAEIIKHRLVHPTEGHRMSQVYVEGKGWYGWNTVYHVYNAVQNYEQWYGWNTVYHVYNAVQNYEQMTTDDLKAVDYSRNDDDGQKPRQPATVFLVCLHVDYEGFDIVGVYRTYEAASKGLAQAIQVGTYYDRTSIDEYTVEE